MNKYFADRAIPLSGSAIRATFKVLSVPGMMYFAGGVPSPELYPKEEMAQIASDILLNDGRTALQYGITEGYTPLIEQVTKRLGGISKDDDQVIITAGGQQGLALTAHSLINEGDIVLAESPSFIGGLNCFRSYAANIVGIEMEEDGLNIELLEQELKRCKVKLLYTIPTFQNPTGITLSLEKRKKLLELADKYDFLILEDNPYSELRFSGDPVPTLKELDTNNRVIYCGSFSKIIAPGLRVGFICANSELVQKMEVCKQTADVHTSVLPQMMISKYLNMYDIDKHIKKASTLYGEKCSFMRECIEKYFPDYINPTNPEGGLFLWCYSDKDFDSKELYEKAIESKVAFVHGSSLMPDSSKVSSAFRLNYSTASIDLIEKGIKTLGGVIKNYAG